MRPIAERAGLTTIQLACQWNLAHEPVRVRGADADPGGRPEARADRGQARRAGRAARARSRLTADDVDAIRRAGRQHRLHGAQGRQPEYEGEEQPDRWALDERLVERRAPLGDRARARPRHGAAAWRRREPSASPAAAPAARCRFEITAPLRGGDLLPLHPLPAPHAVPPPRPTAAPSPGRSGSSRARTGCGPGSPDGGAEKWFCGDCGSALFSRSTDDAADRRPPGRARRRPRDRPDRPPVRGLRRRLGADPRRRAAALPRGAASGLTVGLAASLPASSSRIHSQPTDRSSTPIAAATLSHMP